MVDAIELLDAVQLVGLGPTGSPRTPDRVDVREAPLRLRADQALAWVPVFDTVEDADLTTTADGRGDGTVCKWVTGRRRTPCRCCTTPPRGRS